MTLLFTLSSLRLRAFRSPAPPYPFLFSRPLKSAVTFLHLLLASVKGTVANSMLSMSKTIRNIFKETESN